jgi:hypothetical protein
MRSRASWLSAVLLFAWLGSSGCVDEIHVLQVQALGPEDPNVPPGPLHRPGQPCLECHGGEGPSKTQFSFGGTVYMSPGSKAPAVGASVQVEDSNGAVVVAQSNQAGNFFVSIIDWEPKYPTWQQVSLGSMTQIMATHSGREGSCAFCHANQAGPTSAGQIYINFVSADGGP